MPSSSQAGHTGLTLVFSRASATRGQVEPMRLAISWRGTCCFPSLTISSSSRRVFLASSAPGRGASPASRSRLRTVTGLKSSVPAISLALSPSSWRVSMSRMRSFASRHTGWGWGFNPASRRHLVMYCGLVLTLRAISEGDRPSLCSAIMSFSSTIVMGLNPALLR
ncbi:hypothetical protein ES708_04152 [subsurface metagenome]